MWTNRKRGSWRAGETAFYVRWISTRTPAWLAYPLPPRPWPHASSPQSDFHLLSVGAESGLYRWTVTGELETRVTCSSPSALGLAVSRRPGEVAKAIAVGGSAGTVDVFHDPSYRAFTLRVQED